MVFDLSLLAADVELPSTSNSETTIEINNVVGFHYRLCEVDSEGNKGEWFEESKNKGLLYYMHGYQNVVIGSDGFSFHPQNEESILD